MEVAVSDARQTPALTSDRLVAAYLHEKAQKEAFVRQSDAIIERFDTRMGTLTTELLKLLNASGQDSFQTQGCTVYKSEEVQPIADDWATIYRFIEKNQAWDMLERRLKKTFVATYMEANKKKTPPGVSVLRKYVAKVRRNPKKKEKLYDAQ